MYQNVAQCHTWQSIKTKEAWMILSALSLSISPWPTALLCRWFNKVAAQLADWPLAPIYMGCAADCGFPWQILSQAVDICSLRQANFTLVRWHSMWAEPMIYSSNVSLYSTYLHALNADMAIHSNIWNKIPDMIINILVAVCVERMFGVLFYRFK